MIDRRNTDSRGNRRNQSSLDRRSAAREASCHKVRFLRAGSPADNVLHGELRDVSASGLRIALDEHLEKHDHIMIEVRDAEQKHCFNLAAEVVWVAPSPDADKRVGCELRANLSMRQFELLKSIAATSNSAD